MRRSYKKRFTQSFGSSCEGLRIQSYHTAYTHISILIYINQTNQLLYIPVPAFALASARYVSGMPNCESHTAAAGLGQSGSQYHTTSTSISHAVAQIGIERGPASEVVSKLDDHSVLTFHKILIPGRVIDRDNKQIRKNRPDPP